MKSPGITPNPHLLPLTVDDQHLDAMRHQQCGVSGLRVEQVAWDHSHQLGLSWDDYAPRTRHGGTPPRTGLPRPDGCRRSTAAGHLDHQRDRLSITRAYQFIRQSDHKTVFRGTTRWVCVDLESGCPRRLPANLNAPISAHWYCQPQRRKPGPEQKKSRYSSFIVLQMPIAHI